MTNICEHCAAPVEKQRRNRPNRFCSLACYYAHPRAKRPGISHRLVRAPSHPIAPNGGILAAARIALYDAIGPGPHNCHWCGTTIEWKPGTGTSVRNAIVVDHLNHDGADDRVENLAPSCNPCNAHRTKTGDRAVIGESELFVTNANGTRTRAIKRRCEMCSEPFIARISQVKVGKGLYCSRSCARKAPHFKHQE